MKCLGYIYYPTDFNQLYQIYIEIIKVLNLKNPEELDEMFLFFCLYFTKRTKCLLSTKLFDCLKIFTQPHPENVQVPGEVCL